MSTRALAALAAVLILTSALAACRSQPTAGDGSQAQAEASVAPDQTARPAVRATADKPVAPSTGRQAAATRVPTVQSDDPLVPTLAADTGVAEPPPVVDAMATPEPPAILLPVPAPGSLRSRLGVSVPRGIAVFDETLARRLGVGWYLDWTMGLVPPLDLPGVEFAHMVLMRQGGFLARRQQLAATIAAHPGALWLISNEPDVAWQDDMTPDEYALEYHQFYIYIKSLDPNARVVVGGLSQPTPMRLSYLDQMLEAYATRFARPLPADAWHVHAFILREERNSWGVGIPKGFFEDQGQLFEIEQHDDPEIFRQQLIDFRRWMAEHGQRNLPLIVSEYGILMPEGYGFPPERVAEFMAQSFDFMLFAQDPDIGYPADEDRLVQRLAWFSWSDTVYPTGNLVEPGSDRLTLVGQRFAVYAARLAEME